MKIYRSGTELIGRTPLLELTRIEKKLSLKARILAKLEGFNPAGSAKDRAALMMILDAEKDGRLSPGATIIEPTSGNTGIGLASIAIPLGYKVIIVMPETMSEERRRMMKAYGAELVLTDGKKGMAGAIEKAKELALSIPGSFIPSQFDNPSNAKAHYTWTGPEIYEDTEGNVDIFISAIGTGGTITGCGRYLKEKIPGIKIIGVEPSSSPVLSGGKAGSHRIQGIGAGFIPGVLDTSVYSSIKTVSDDDAFRYARMMARNEGILVGISSGTALKAAVDEAEKSENSGKTIVVIFPDNGDRYLSTAIADD